MNKERTQIILLKKRFLEYLEIEKGRSLKTVENYNRYLMSFFEFSKISKPQDISLEKTREFRIFLNHKKNKNNQELKKNTQNYYLIAIRTFLKFLAKNDIKSLSPDKIELAKTKTRDLDLVSNKEFYRFLEIASNNDFIDLRDRAIIETFYSTGLRISELCSLKKDIDLNSSDFSIRGKGGKVRIVFLSKRASKHIKKYLDKRAEIENSDINITSTDKSKKFYKKFKSNSIFQNALFLTKNGTPMSPRSIQLMIEKRSIQACVSKKITPHTIRHFFATDLLKNGADIRSIQKILGHSSINTTQIYTNISDNFLKEVYDKFHDKKK